MRIIYDLTKPHDANLTKNDTEKGPRYMLTSHIADTDICVTTTSLLSAEYAARSLDSWFKRQHGKELTLLDSTRGLAFRCPTLAWEQDRIEFNA